jgi:hypothetical protein
LPLTARYIGQLDHSYAMPLLLQNFVKPQLPLVSLIRSLLLRPPWKLTLRGRNHQHAVHSLVE